MPKDSSSSRVGNSSQLYVVALGCCHIANLDRSSAKEEKSMKLAKKKERSKSYCVLHEYVVNVQALQ